MAVKLYLVYFDMFDYMLREEKCNIMLSYAAIKPGLEVKIPEGFPEIMLDSGGFQLQQNVKGARTISITGYAAWLQYALPKYPEIVAYMNMDIPGNVNATLDNQEYLEHEGLHPLPIWHIDDGDDLLDYYCARYDYVAIGGMVTMRLNKKDMGTLLERIKTRYPTTKFHMLGAGIAASTAFQNLRPYSMDFSTWMTSFRFGNDLVWGKNGLLHEKKMDEERRNRMRSDKKFKHDFIREILRKLKTYAERLDTFQSPGMQGQLELRV